MIVHMQPGGIWFGTPSVCDAVPAAGAGDVARRRLFPVHEDLWRGVELVRTADAEAVNSTMEEIADVYRHRAGPGSPFDRVAIRQEPAAPLGLIGIPLSELIEILGAIEWLDGVGYGSTHVIPDSFCFRDNRGLVTYGIARDGHALVIAFADEQPYVFEALTERLAPLLLSRSLILVDWRRLRRGAAQAAD